MTITTSEAFVPMERRRVRRITVFNKELVAHKATMFDGKDSGDLCQYLDGFKVYSF